MAVQQVTLDLGDTPVWAHIESLGGVTAHSMRPRMQSTRNRQKELVTSKPSGDRTSGPAVLDAVALWQLDVRDA